MLVQVTIKQFFSISDSMAKSMLCIIISFKVLKIKVSNCHAYKEICATSRKKNSTRVFKSVKKTSACALKCCQYC